MFASFLLYITLYSLIAYHLIAHTINCTTANQCESSIINCLPNEDCSIFCTQISSCQSSIINCPLNGTCNILCVGGEACRSATINATLSSGNFNLSCIQSTDHCNSIKIYGSILDTNTGNFNVLCDGKMRSCSHSEIQCPHHGNCTVTCNDDTSCRWLHITGPSKGDLTMICNGTKSCFDAILDASDSSMLDVTGCIEDSSCMDLTLYCPPNSNGYKNCFIEANDNLARDNARGTQIYAVNGWNDVHIEYNGIFGPQHDGTMYCGANYDISCDIAPDAWSCVDPDVCNVFIDTITTEYPIQQSTIQTTQNIHFSTDLDITTSMTTYSDSKATIITFYGSILSTYFTTDSDNKATLEVNRNRDYNNTLQNLTFSLGLEIVTIAVIMAVLVICCILFGFCCLYAKRNQQFKSYEADKPRNEASPASPRFQIYNSNETKTHETDDSLRLELGVTSVSIDARKDDIPENLLHEIAERLSRTETMVPPLPQMFYNISISAASGSYDQKIYDPRRSSSQGKQFQKRKSRSSIYVGNRMSELNCKHNGSNLTISDSNNLSKRNSLDVPRDSVYSNNSNIPHLPIPLTNIDSNTSIISYINATNGVSEFDVKDDVDISAPLPQEKDSGENEYENENKRSGDSGESGDSAYEAETKINSGESGDSDSDSHNHSDMYDTYPDEKIMGGTTPRGPDSAFFEKEDAEGMYTVPPNIKPTIPSAVNDNSFQTKGFIAT